MANPLFLLRSADIPGWLECSLVFDSEQARAAHRSVWKHGESGPAEKDYVGSHVLFTTSSREYLSSPYICQTFHAHDLTHPVRSWVASRHSLDILETFFCHLNVLKMSVKCRWAFAYPVQMSQGGSGPMGIATMNVANMLCDYRKRLGSAMVRIHMCR